MKAGKAVGPSGITSELLKVCKKESVKKLAHVVDDLFHEKEMPMRWKKSDLIPIHKSKGDIRSSVKLLEYGMKVIKRIFEKRLRNVVTLNEMLMGFMPGRGMC